MIERIGEAASMATLGLDPWKYLESRDVQERAVMIELHNRALELRDRMMHNLAVDIASQVGQLFKK
jgi:hypothetical protein